MDLQQDVILPFELEDVLSKLKVSTLTDVGGPDWSNQSSLVEEINIQAAIEASRGGEELVRDRLVDRGLLPLVVNELITMNVWREEVLPRILKIGNPESSFQIYMALFYQVNLVNLLETVLYSEQACDSLSDSAIDLADFCILKLTYLISGDLIDGEVSGGLNKSMSKAELMEELANWTPGKELPEIPIEDVADEIQRHLKETNFQMAMKAITILRYLTDHLDNLPLGVTSRLVLTYDVPILFIQLIEEKPWVRKKDNKKCEEIFEGSDWVALKEDDYDNLPKLEAQVWLGLYNMFSKKQCSEKYEIHHYRRNMIVKLDQYLNEILINQLPILESFRRWIVELSMGSSPSAPSMATFLIEAVAEIKENIINKYKSSWDRIAKEQAEIFLSESSSSYMVTQAARLMKAFDLESVQTLTSAEDIKQKEAEDRRNCAYCKKPSAKNRCSRCHNQRYCDRDCQLKHWSKHKLSCQEK